MASPAEIANDMAAHATYWAKRDRVLERTCQEAAQAIRDLLAGQRLDGRRWGGLHRRLLRQERREPTVQGYPDFTRARTTIETLQAEARRA